KSVAVRVASQRTGGLGGSSFGGLRGSPRFLARLSNTISREHWIVTLARPSLGRECNRAGSGPQRMPRDGSLESEGGINAVKLLRACGGCLGARRRRRAWKTAISPAELSDEH